MKRVEGKFNMEKVKWIDIIYLGAWKISINLDATQSKRLAVDEWGTLAKTQADMVDAYEQQQAQIALDSRVQNRKQLRIQADNKEQQQKETIRQMRMRERAEADTWCWLLCGHRHKQPHTQQDGAGGTVSTVQLHSGGG